MICSRKINLCVSPTLRAAHFSPLVQCALVHLLKGPSCFSWLGKGQDDGSDVPPLHFANVPVYWLRFQPAPGSTISCVNLYFNRAAAAALSPVLSPHRQGEVTPPRTIHSRVSFSATPHSCIASSMSLVLGWGRHTWTVFTNISSYFPLQFVSLHHGVSMFFERINIGSP